MSRCPVCGEVVATGSLCDVIDTDCIDITGAGSEASPHGLSPILDVDTDQLLTCTSSGLKAILPTYLTDPPFCMVAASGEQSIPNDTLTAITFDIEHEDTDGMWSAANPTRITFQEDAEFTVNATMAWKSHQVGDRLMYVRRNGSGNIGLNSKPTAGTGIFAGGPSQGDLETGHTFTTEYPFGTGDYIEMMVRQTSGAALLVVSDAYSPFLTVVKR